MEGERLGHIVGGVEHVWYLCKTLSLFRERPPRFRDKTTSHLSISSNRDDLNHNSSLHWLDTNCIPVSVRGIFPGSRNAWHSGLNQLMWITIRETSLACRALGRGQSWPDSDWKDLERHPEPGSSSSTGPEVAWLSALVSDSASLGPHLPLQLKEGWPPAGRSYGAARWQECTWAS